MLSDRVAARKYREGELAKQLASAQRDAQRLTDYALETQDKVVARYQFCAICGKPIRWAMYCRQCREWLMTQRRAAQTTPDGTKEGESGH